MIHLFLYGLLLGWGAAIPVGPINLEMMRRNLQYGVYYGLSFGFAACCADLTYITLICFGALTFLKSAFLMTIIGTLGACVLFWFAYQAFTLAAVESTSHENPKTIRRSFGEGYLLTMVNPPTILFWISVSSQVLLTTQGHQESLIIAGSGVALATFSWVLGLNIVLKLLHHKLSREVMKVFNHVGAIILILFACYTLYQVLFGF